MSKITKNFRIFVKVYKWNEWLALERKRKKNN